MSGGRKIGDIDNNHHYRSGRIGEWKEYFKDEHVDFFKKNYKNIFKKLKYEEM